MNYNKLVRDKIPEYIASKGEKAVTHIADDAEYWQKLREKLQEEVNEFLNDESVGEVADIFEVLDAICEYKQYHNDELTRVKEKKAAERGMFKKRIILDEV